jgi:hypothetical protein
MGRFHLPRIQTAHWHGRRHWVAMVIVALPLLIAAATREATDFTPRQCDPATVLGPDTCTRCHQAETTQWMQTPHYRTFDTLHRTPEAKAIADRLGLRSIKRDPTCVSCHYTPQLQGDRERLVAGVSCESCHGGARDWLERHADYGGPNVTRATESPEHRQARREASVAAGMNNPSNLYLVARQCLSCHTVPNESLVNVGHHKAGTTEFELVAWSQGKVRHNFVSADGHANPTSTPERLRVMYVVGIMADLEASLRATAEATEVANFAQTSAARAADRKQRLWQVQRLIDNPSVAKALAAVAQIELKLGNRDQLLEAASAVGQAAYEFAETDGSTLSAIDSLLPSPSQYKN